MTIIADNRLVQTECGTYLVNYAKRASLEHVMSTS